MRIVFMGTPEFAVPPLAALFERHEVAAAATRPDKPAGRGNKIQPSPVKAFAEQRGLPVLQPRKASDNDFLESLKSVGADVFIIAAYGLILPKNVLELPKYGCLNIHASLLPKYRGASPIQQAIIDGEARTGVTVMRMDEGLDTGDIVLQRTVNIAPEDTAGTLTAKLSAAGAGAILAALNDIESGRAVYTAQGADFTYAPLITKEKGRLDFTKTTVETVNLIRAMNPWPLCFAHLNGEQLKIHSARVFERGPAETGHKPGQIADIIKDGIVARAADGYVLLKEVQAGGGRAMPAFAYTRGHDVRIGDSFD